MVCEVQCLLQDGRALFYDEAMKPAAAHWTRCLELLPKKKFILIMQVFFSVNFQILGRNSSTGAQSM
jgi:hypothetical protein